jgi:hypothetical protein
VFLLYGGMNLTLPSEREASLPVCNQEENERQATEKFLVIISTASELHRSIVEQLATHFVAESQIIGYAIYTIYIEVTIS